MAAWSMSLVSLGLDGGCCCREDHDRMESVMRVSRHQVLDGRFGHGGFALASPAVLATVASPSQSASRILSLPVCVGCGVCGVKCGRSLRCSHGGAFSEHPPKEVSEAEVQGEVVGTSRLTMDLTARAGGVARESVMDLCFPARGREPKSRTAHTYKWTLLRHLCSVIDFQLSGFFSLLTHISTRSTT